MAENVQKKLSVMSVESDNNINSSSNCMLYSVSSIIFPVNVHDKLVSKCVHKKSVDSVRVRF